MTAVDTVRTLAPLTRTDLVRYAGASGDFNPIHHDEPYAQTLGLPSVFAMGMLPGGILAAHVAHLYGASNVVRVRLRFRGQVWPGDELTLSAVGGDVDAEGRTDVALEVRVAGRGVVVSGTATIRGHGAA